MKKDKWIFDSKWIVFYFKWCFEITYETCGYFDPKHRINLCLIFFRLQIILPIKSKHTDECDPPQWGIAIHNNTFWVYKGGEGNMNGGNKWWTYHFPWEWKWFRTSNLRKDGEWEHEVKGDRKNFYEDKWKELLWSATYPYNYKLKSGEIQDVIATIKLSEKEWKFKGLMFLKYPRKISRCIEIEFSDEVGERAGSWKGGCTGCSYELRSGELPEHCLKRMEKERKF